LTESPSPALEYLIPRAIRQGYEFAPGWGLVQVGAVLVGLLIGGLLFLTLHLLRAPVFVQVFPLILGGGLGVLVARPLMDGSTVLDLLAAYRDWSRRPKRYLYDWGRDDWPE